MVTITCLECNHSFQVPQSRIPGPTFKAKCPACQKVFQARILAPLNDSVPRREPNRVETVSSNALWDKLRPEVEALVKNQLDAVRSDILLSLASLGGRQAQNVASNTDSLNNLRALICQSDPEVAQHLAAVFQHLNYSVQTCSSCTEALGRLERGFFNVITTDLIFPDDMEGGSKILGKINARKPDERRKMFVAVVAEQVRTMGPQTAFFQGANIIVQKSDLSSFENLLEEGLRYYSELYSNYSELMQQTSERL